MNKKYIDAHYTNLKCAEVYDYDSPWSIERDFYLKEAGVNPIRILDIGCGTGLICLRLAEMGHLVTGADPANAMLKIAQKNDHQNKVRWVESFAEDLKFDNEFDYIIMTGNAFQALLTEEIIEKTFINMKKALRHNGKIIFESRNPQINWAERWNYQEKLVINGKAIIEKRVLKSFKNSVMIFDLEYHFPDEVIITESIIRFWSQIEIQNAFHKAGLTLTKLMGEWDKSDFDSTHSLEMIFELK